MQKRIEIHNLFKQFGKEHAVSDFSMDVNDGEVFAFLGSNGSGKTTTIRCLLNIYQPDSGTLLVNGKPYTSEQNAAVGYLPEERGLYTKVKIMDVFYYFGELRGLTHREVKKLADDYLEKVGLIEHRDKKISQLSSGMQQKIQIGVTLLHKPNLLILDEPFKGLDPLNRQMFNDLFRELKEQGTTILYSTHVVDEAQRLADRLVMIKKGIRVLYGTIDEVRNAEGSNTVHLEFAGKLPRNEKLFAARIEQRSAELTPAAGVTPQEIIKYLVANGTEITEFKIERPSLNEIFIRHAQNNV